MKRLGIVSALFLIIFLIVFLPVAIIDDSLQEEKRR